MGIQQGLVTVTGNLGANPTSFSGKDGTPACSFRVGVTPRYYDSRSGQWRDRNTSWINVRAYRTLAMNIMGSLNKGDPVIVTGTLHSDRWQKDGVDREMPVIEANAVGHDLSQGVANFGRRRQPNMGQPNMGQQANTQGNMQTNVQTAGGSGGAGTVQAPVVQAPVVPPQPAGVQIPAAQPQPAGQPVDLATGEIRETGATAGGGPSTAVQTASADGTPLSEPEDGFEPGDFQ
ncbi:single-stranded DNA-binding protein [Bifidobacterium saguinibicoloris]|uniref:single-stranded DNA-binding protein n=1 Tax=Bifidobacterium saguinibicoloris TaxID=2834433 RepID=UPI001C560E0C|nr:single-stranded DNA-binding protein [Bifidobacterium saguinibicoloris]MBW3080458.1 single-stranded DNA-binding protein [Bifidobacterium saguinibicoloris]